jgi:hypothetical protein
VIWPEKYDPKTSAIYALNDIDGNALPQGLWRLLFSKEVSAHFRGNGPTNLETVLGRLNLFQTPRGMTALAHRSHRRGEQLGFDPKHPALSSTSRSRRRNTTSEGGRASSDEVAREQWINEGSRIAV